MEYKFNSRSDVPTQYKWDLTRCFKNDDAWYSEFNEVKLHVEDLKKYKGIIFEDDNLYNLLDSYYSYCNRLEKLYIYAMMKQDEDLSVDNYIKMFGEIVDLYTKFMENMSYMMPEILHSKNFNIDKLIKDNPKLKRFEHILRSIELEKEYVKSEEIEQLITILTKDIDSYSDLSSTILNSDIDYGTIKDENGKEVSLNVGNSSLYLSSKDRRVRESAYMNLVIKRKQFSNTLGKNLIEYMKRQSTLSKIRGYKSTKDMHFKLDHIPLNVHDSLLQNIQRGLPLFQKFNRIYKKLINVDVLHPYDLDAPVVQDEKKYTIEDAQKYIYEATSVLGKNYSDLIKRAFDEHWIDYMPYKNKESGGYCCRYEDIGFILLSYNGNFRDVSTIAHELGHALNYYNIYKNNSIEYVETTHYVAEIASLTNEILLANYIINNDFSKDEKLTVIINLLKVINSNFFGGVMENELENIIYERIDSGESITPDDLTRVTSNLIDKYYGDTLQKDDYYKYMWTRRSHYFVPWYLYKYSTCTCGAVFFASKILDGDNETLDLYLNFLKQGVDEFPNKILNKFGIDFTDSKIYDQLFDYYNMLLDKLAELTQ